MAIVYYVFQPKQELLDVVATYKDGKFGEPFITGQVWNSEAAVVALQDKGVRAELLTHAKLSFLTRIMPDPQHSEMYVHLIHTLFGNPARYSIENLDRWWTAVLMGPGPNMYRYWIDEGSAEKAEKLEKTGDPEIDAWLEQFPQSLRELRQHKGV